MMTSNFWFKSGSDSRSSLNAAGSPPPSSPGCIIDGPIVGLVHSHLLSGPNLSRKFNVTVVLKASSVCNTSRPNLCAPDSRWRTMECEPCSALLRSQPDRGSLPSRAGQEPDDADDALSRTQPGKFCKCKWPRYVLCYLEHRAVMWSESMADSSRVWRNNNVKLLIRLVQIARCKWTSPNRAKRRPALAVA